MSALYVMRFFACPETFKQAGQDVYFVDMDPVGGVDSAQVKAWLNLGGILQGVPVLDQVSSGFKGVLFSGLQWIKGWEKSSFESMYTTVSRSRFATLAVPGHIAIYNYVSLSLSGDISKFAKDKYLMMRDEGPNDGLTLLPDILALLVTLIERIPD